MNMKKMGFGLLMVSVLILGSLEGARSQGVRSAGRRGGRITRSSQLDQVDQVMVVGDLAADVIAILRRTDLNEAQKVALLRDLIQQYTGMEVTGTSMTVMEDESGE